MVAFPSILDTPMLAPLGAEAPPVYRVFPWHPPERAAQRIVADLERRRRESYLSLSDRGAAWLADAFPALFTRGLHAIVRLRDPGAGSTRGTPR